jgi:hypothetical protein
LDMRHRRLTEEVAALAARKALLDAQLEEERRRAASPLAPLSAPSAPEPNLTAPAPQPGNDP